MFLHYSNCAVKNTSMKSHNVCIVSNITKTVKLYLYIHKYKKMYDTERGQYEKIN